MSRSNHVAFVRTIVVELARGVAVSCIVGLGPVWFWTRYRWTDTLEAHCGPWSECKIV